MLIEFSASNFRSIRSKQTLSLVAGKGDELRRSNTVAISPTLSLVRSAVIYGANAAGKSNLLIAVQALQNLVSMSNLVQEGARIAVDPFRLSPECADEPTTLEIMFEDDGIRYQYGLKLTPARVTGEWLIAYPHGTKQRWFERNYMAANDDYEWKFGSNFKSDRAQRQLSKRVTRANGLFLATAVQLNDDQLRPVFAWITRKFAVINQIQSMNWAVTGDAMTTISSKVILEKLLRAADVGITGLDLIEEEPSQQPTFMIQVAGAPPANFFHVKDGQPRNVRVMTLHKTTDGTLVPFELKDESQGTIKLLHYGSGLVKALSEGMTILIDEFETSLHPLLTKRLLEMFHDPELNAAGAQLIITTHDTNLLDHDLIRRDQVWFVEKDEVGATILYSLLDFSPRKDEVLERGYLRGKFGAIPKLGEFAA